MAGLRARVDASALLEALPGIGATLGAVGVAYLVSMMVDGISPLIIALVLGVVLANLGLDLRRLAPGFAIASRPLLRFGIVLLGLKVSIDAVLALGAPAVVAVVVCTGVAFLATIGIGRLLGLDTTRSLLMASGVSICGASAVAAMDGVVKGKDEDVTASVATVSALGLVCIALLPALQGPLGLTDDQVGMWAGLSVHEVAQVVATAAVPGVAALTVAVPIKLGRVLLLAPILAVTSIVLRRRSAGTPANDQSAADRPPIVPLFVLGFIGMVALTSLVDLPTPVLVGADIAQTVLMSAAMFAIGASVQIHRLLRSSGRLLLLGAISTVLLLCLGLAAVLVIGAL